MGRPHYLADMIACITPERDGPVRELPKRVVAEDVIVEEPRKRPPICITSTEAGERTRALIVQVISASACTARDVALALDARGHGMARHSVDRTLLRMVAAGILRRHELLTSRDIERAGGRFLYEVAR